MFSYEEALSEQKRMVDFRAKHYGSAPEPATKQEPEVVEEDSPAKITPIENSSTVFPL